MKKLTKAQQETVNKVTENYINSNEPLLFDKDHAIKMGEQFKKELQELTLFNMTIKEQRRLQATKDYEYLCNLFEPYDKLIEFKEYSEEYVVTIGHNTKLKIFLTYKFRCDDWVDQDSYIDKNGKRRNPKLNKRLEVLKKIINEQIRRINNEENTELIKII